MLYDYTDTMYYVIFPAVDQPVGDVRREYRMHHLRIAHLLRILEILYVYLYVNFIFYKSVPSHINASEFWSYK